MVQCSGICSENATFDLFSAGGEDCANEAVAECAPASVTEVTGVEPPSGAIPTASEWGLIVMTLLLLTAGTILVGRRRRAAG